MVENLARIPILRPWSQIGMVLTLVLVSLGQKKIQNQSAMIYKLDLIDIGGVWGGLNTFSLKFHGLNRIYR